MQAKNQRKNGCTRAGEPEQNQNGTISETRTTTFPDGRFLCERNEGGEWKIASFGKNAK
jgi:hypothetical protein